MKTREIQLVEPEAMLLSALLATTRMNKHVYDVFDFIFDDFAGSDDARQQCIDALACKLDDCARSFGEDRG